MRQPSPTTWLAALSAIASLFAATVMWTGGLYRMVGTIELRSGSPARALVIAFAAAAALTFISYRKRAKRSLVVGMTLLITSAVLALLARPAGESWPVGDAALIELNVVRALEGRALLGAYSRFGWHHPGPLPFYALAPFYGLGGRSASGLVVGVFLTNLACVAVLGAILVRYRRELPWFLVPALFGLLLTYLLRVPTLLTSAWNPHSLMLPLLTLLVATAACLHDSPRAILLVALLASFVVQAHVSLAGVAGLLLAWCAWRLVIRWRTEPTEARAIERVGLVALVLLQLLWLLPLSEQVVRSPGNLTLIWRFFRGEDPVQSFTHAFRAWSSALAIVFQPTIELAGGGHLADVSHTWLGAAGTGTLIALLVATRRARQGGRLFVFWLGAVAIVSSVVGLWSVVQVRGPIGDYQVFWLSIVGVVNLAVVLSEIASHMSSLGRPAFDAMNRHAPRVAAIAARAGVAGTALIGLDLLLLPHHTPMPWGEMDVVRDLMTQLTVSLPQTGNRQPVVRLHNDMWSIGAGVVLQLKRQGLETTVIKEHGWLFDEGMTTSGREDILLDVVRTRDRGAVAGRRRNVTLAQTRDVVVEAVSLVDEPDYRPH